ncbi:MAG: hypothetical protein ACYCVD_12290 [Desulfitobacteriaceae bacterium]
MKPKLHRVAYPLDGINEETCNRFYILNNYSLSETDIPAKYEKIFLKKS